MKVFISWSGERSKAAGLALRQWLPRVFQHIDIWMSDRDIPAGAMWLHEIMEQLKGANFGVVCITPENRDRSWIHFEAGAIARAVENTNYVCPYLISLQGIDLHNNPLSNFQYKESNESGTKGLVESMNKVFENPLKSDVLQETFEIWWPKLRATLSEIPEIENKPEIMSKPHDMLGEVLEGIRRIERSIAEGMPFRSHIVGRADLTQDAATVAASAVSATLGQLYAHGFSPGEYRGLTGRSSITEPPKS